MLTLPNSYSLKWKDFPCSLVPTYHFLHWLYQLTTNYIIFWWLPKSSRKPHFSSIPLFWIGFQLISMGISKNEFCNNKSIFSSQSNVIMQLFHFSSMYISQNLDLVPFFGFLWWIYVDLSSWLPLFPFPFSLICSFVAH